jgi:hypothetical protein
LTAPVKQILSTLNATGVSFEENGTRFDKAGRQRTSSWPV